MAKNKPVYTVEEARALTNSCKVTFYKAIREKEVPSIRIGRRIFIPKAKYDAILSGEVQQ